MSSSAEKQQYPKLYEKSSKREIKTTNYTNTTDKTSFLKTDIYNCDELIVCNSTGIRDSEGNILYDGDIIRYGDPDTKKFVYRGIFYSCKEARFKLRSKNKEYDITDSALKCMNTSVRVGNVFNNIELLSND